MLKEVALRKESVDRNSDNRRSRLALDVALRKESVDRNFSACQKKIGRLWSLSARRAWIEMAVLTAPSTLKLVALRKESVDRNLGIDYYKSRIDLSLSARRAWIEIMLWLLFRVVAGCRSPQGERG